MWIDQLLHVVIPHKMIESQFQKAFKEKYVRLIDFMRDKRRESWQGRGGPRLDLDRPFHGKSEDLASWSAKPQSDSRNEAINRFLPVPLIRREKGRRANAELEGMGGYSLMARAGATGIIYFVTRTYELLEKHYW